MDKNKNIIIVILLIVVVVGGYLFFKKETIDHGTLFALKEECAEKAKQYADQRTTSSINADSQWEVLHSDYVTSRKSCVAEFRHTVYVYTENGEDSSYLYIYDLLTGETVASLKLTYEESWEDEAPAAYQKIRKGILGLERN